MTIHHIVPPYLLENLERTADDPNLRARYRQSLQHDAVLRTRPAARREAEAPSQGEASGPGPRRLVHDAEHGTDLPGVLVRSGGEPPVQDSAVNQAYDGTGATWTMFRECFGRDSVDGAGLPLSSSVHYDRDYANAFWDGAQMVFGDGDGEIFRNFTSSIDVTAHELTHGVTQYTANLLYEGQSGALNESVSDVFGSLAKQHHLGQSTAEADWLIGAELFRPGVNAVALRSLKEPGTAYDDPRLGQDPQPAHMDGYVETTDDNGGVHINSGIPNRAFYLTAAEIGGNAYDDAGKIWYSTLTSGNLPPAATFTDFATATLAAATDLFGPDSSQLTAVTTAWHQVGVLPPDQPPTTPDNQPADVPADVPTDEPAAEPADASGAEPSEDAGDGPPPEPGNEQGDGADDKSADGPGEGAGTEPTAQPADTSDSEPSEDAGDGPSLEPDNEQSDGPGNGSADGTGEGAGAEPTGPTTGPSAESSTDAGAEPSTTEPGGEAEDLPGQSAESVELMRAAKIALDPNTPPAPPSPPRDGPRVAATPEPATPEPATPEPDAPEPDAPDGPDSPGPPEDAAGHPPADS